MKPFVCFFYTYKSLIEKIHVLLLHQVINTHNEFVCVWHHRVWHGVTRGFETFMVMKIAIALEVKVVSKFGIVVTIEMVVMTIRPKMSFF